MSELAIPRPVINDARNTAEGARKLPICVDLDGTLFRTDTLVECALAFLRLHPAAAFLLVVWLFKGKAHLKEQLALHAELDTRVLPVREQLIDYLESEKAAGREIFLATAADLRVAQSVVAQLPLFSGLFASDGSTNLSGRNKRQRLTGQFGDKGFIYVGNSRADLAVWKSCAGAVIVDGSRKLIRALGAEAPIVRVFPREKGRLRSMVREMRVYQWVKNTLVFLPLVGAHLLVDPWLMGKAFLAFVAFSLCASAVYTINDLFDLKPDRLHPEKRKRPLAAGDLSPQAGVALAAALLLGASVPAAMLSGGFAAVLACYFTLTFGYSLAFKKQPVLDVLVLAGLYTVRVFGGELATGVQVSEWLLAFSMFIFLSLALLKRYSELVSKGADGQVTTNGRGYQVVDSAVLATLGGAAGYLAVLVLALYINNEHVSAHYSRPRFLWLAAPLLLYWVSRIWILAGRGEVHHDPIVFSFKDRATYVVVFLIALLLVLSGPL
ncbi:MAG: UbiA family prenyltransferase [Acidobacteria bacterium]|nr:MAG: UbiA family prenyltransferase [Acidobacteriota bacterium]